MRRRILRQTDEEILEEDKKIEQEIADGIIPDPSIPMDPETGMPIDPMAMEGESDLGAPVADPDLEGESLSPVGNRELPKGGEI